MPTTAGRPLPARRLAVIAGLATIAGHASVPASAVGYGADGCRALAQAVAAGVREALWRRLVEPGRLPQPPLTTLVDDAPARCGMTTATASAAFAKTYREYGIAIGWSGEAAAGANEACGTRLLDRCRPVPLPAPRTLANDPVPLVADTWAVVTAGIRRRMPFGVASDWSYFRPSALGETLAVGIDATLNRPRRTPVPDRQDWDER